MKKRHEQAIVAVVIIAVIGAYFTGYLDEYIPDDYDSDVIIGKIEDFRANRPSGNDDDDDSTGDDDDTTGDDDDTSDVAGDINCDGVLNDYDVDYLSRYIIGTPGYEDICDGADMNCDGDEDSGDVRYLAMFLLGDPDYMPLYPGGC